MVFRMGLVQTTLVPLEKEAKEKVVEIITQENTRKEYKYSLYKNSNMVMTDTKAIAHVDEPHVVWIDSEQDGLYGVQKVVSVDDSCSLTALPTLKDLNQLEVGKYYKLTYKGLVDLGGYCKKMINVEEIDCKTYEILSLEYNERDRIL